MADGPTVKYFGSGRDGQEFNSGVRDFYFGPNNQSDPNDPIGRPSRVCGFQPILMRFWSLLVINDHTTKGTANVLSA